MKCFFKFSAIFLSFCLLLTGCSVSSASAKPVAEPSYPEMAPYPDESKFIHPVSGEFDSDAFSTVYDAWRKDQLRQRDVPPGYADNLTDYFLSCIPCFLQDNGSNQAVSPLNVYTTLAMLAEITDGSSRQEILNLLQSDSLDDLRHQASLVWNAHYCADGASSCVLANSLWLDSHLVFQQTAVNLLAEHYFSSVFQADLGSEESNRMLRDWLNKQTGGLLTEQAENLSLDSQTALALASTLYYRAKWVNTFQSAGNSDSVFHSPDGDQAVTFMNQELCYGPYYWGTDFGAVSLSLEDGSQMWLILPDEGLTPGDILESGQALQLALGGWMETECKKSLRVNLSLPKFDAGSDLRLDDAFKKLGIASVFGEQADFSPILPGQTAWLDAINHAARVKIDEEGVEAAAYTVMSVCGAGMPPEDEMDFVLDRPFLFLITSRDNLPLFAGIVNAP